jgi:hypothetical protein
MLPISKAPIFKPFNLALVQLGAIGANKSENLKHAREMILRAANGEKPKPDVIVLPVCPIVHSLLAISVLKIFRKFLIRLTDTSIFLSMPKISATAQARSTMYQPVPARACGCYHPQLRRLVYGS